MNDSPSVGAAQRRIVDHLKRSGPCSTTHVAEALGVTTQAVRPQLAELEDRGLVSAEPTATGTRGRPPTGWALTALAIDLFPDRHSDLTVELIDAMKATLGEEAFEAVLAVRDATQLETVRNNTPQGAGVAERTRILADHRTRQGYMAEVIEDGDDLFLVEHHCPVCAAATACQGLCSNELKLFQDAMGSDVDVERTQHLLSGDERCVYRIRTRKDATE